MWLLWWVLKMSWNSLSWQPPEHLRSYFISAHGWNCPWCLPRRCHFLLADSVLGCSAPRHSALPLALLSWVTYCSCLFNCVSFLSDCKLYEGGVSLSPKKELLKDTGWRNEETVLASAFSEMEESCLPTRATVLHRLLDNHECPGLSPGGMVKFL